jgi:esterase
MSGPSRRWVTTTEGLRLSVLDWGGAGQVLFCLHGHFGQGAIYHMLAAALAPAWRVVALDQRGHGFSDHAATYRRDDYLRDALAVLDGLGIDRVVVLGSSLGGVNAYQLAARAPGRVAGLIVEDIGAVCRDDLSWCLSWPPSFPTLAAMQQQIHSYFCESAVQRDDGWGFRFDRAGIVQSGQNLNGDWWTDWLASTCPALLLRGGKSEILPVELAEQMADRRPGCRLQVFPEAGHNINAADPVGYTAAVTAFLARLA